MKTATKLGASFGVLTSLLLIVTGLGVGVASPVSSDVRNGSRSVAATEALKALQLDAATVAIAENSVAYDYASHSDPSADARSFQTATTAYRTDADRAGAGLDAAERSLLGAADNALGSYVALAAQINADFVTGTAGAVRAANAGVAALAFSQVTGPLQHLEEQLNATAGRQDTAALSSASANRTLILGLGLLAALIAVALAVLITRSITRPLRRTVEVLDAVARGDLACRLELHGDDEVGQMAGALNIALSRMEGAVRAIAESASHLGSSSAGLTALSVQLAVGAQETASQAEMASTAAKQVSYNVDTLADATGQMNESIREIAGQATTSVAQGSQGVGLAETTAVIVGRLAQSSAEISGVLGLISSIATQTNLLALNATIEAARAGAAGKGFAVVADEVKALARETAKATSTVAGRIGAIETESSAVVTAIGSIRRLIAEMNEAQSAIAAAVEEQTATTDQLSRNITDVALGSNRIASAAISVAERAGETTGAAASTKTAATEIAHLAGELTLLVGEFHITGQELGRPTAAPAPPAPYGPKPRRSHPAAPANRAAGPDVRKGG